MGASDKPLKKKTHKKSQTFEGCGDCATCHHTPQRPPGWGHLALQPVARWEGPADRRSQSSGGPARRGDSSRAPGRAPGGWRDLGPGAPSLLACAACGGPTRGAPGLGRFYSCFLATALHPAAPSTPALPTRHPLGPPPAQTPALPLGNCRVRRTPAAPGLQLDLWECSDHLGPPQAHAGLAAAPRGRQHRVAGQEPAQKAGNTGLQPSTGRFLPELLNTMSPWGRDRQQEWEGKGTSPSPPVRFCGRVSSAPGMCCTGRRVISH